LSTFGVNELDFPSSLLFTARRRPHNSTKLSPSTLHLPLSPSKTSTASSYTSTGDSKPGWTRFLPLGRIVHGAKTTTSPSPRPPSIHPLEQTRPPWIQEAQRRIRIDESVLKVRTESLESERKEEKLNARAHLSFPFVTSCFVLFSACLDSLLIFSRQLRVSFSIFQQTQLPFANSSSSIFQCRRLLLRLFSSPTLLRRSRSTALLSLSSPGQPSS